MSWIVCIIAITVALIMCLIMKHKMDKSSDEDQKEINSIKAQKDGLFAKLVAASTLCDQKHKRIIDLEDTIENGYGIKVRNEITEVICKFNKLEMVVMLSGISLLISRSPNKDDIKFYFSLIDKITNILPEMKEHD
jgi:hypothetical protein